MAFMLKTKMAKEEFDTGLKQFGLTASDACSLVYNHTEAVISSQEVHKSFDRHGYLSAPMTACFRFLFRVLGNEKI